MINRITQITNDALRERWSTVAILTAILTAGKAYSIRGAFAVDVQGFLAQVFLALLISFLLSMVIHVLLYLIFSPKAKSETPVVIGGTPANQAKNDAAIAEVHDELEAAASAAAAVNGAVSAKQGTTSTFDLNAELAKPAAPQKATATKAKARTMPKAKAKTKASKPARKKTAPKKKAAKKKK